MAPARPSRHGSPLKQTTLARTLFKHSAESRPPLRNSPAPSSAKTRTTMRGTISAAASDRVETDVLLAIQPIHLGNIASQKKNHEYRKYRLRDGVVRLWFYETKGASAGQGKGRAAITHIASIPADTRRTPGTVPEEPVGIGNADFNAGLKKSKYGYPITELYELTEPISLEEMKGKYQMGGAPMGWSYIKSAMWHDLWGDDERSRGERMKRIF